MLFFFFPQEGGTRKGERERESGFLSRRSALKIRNKTYRTRGWKEREEGGIRSPGYEIVGCFKRNFTNLQVVRARVRSIKTSLGVLCGGGDRQKYHPRLSPRPRCFRASGALSVFVYAIQVFFPLSLSLTFFSSFHEQPFIARIRFDVKRFYFFSFLSFFFFFSNSEILSPSGEIVLMLWEKKEGKFERITRENLASFLQRERRNGNISYRPLLPSSFLRNAFDQISISGNLLARDIRSRGYRYFELIKGRASF